VLKRNVIANFVGRGWTAATYLAFTPLYIHFVGIEAYGLVGFYLTLVAVSSLLELGLSSSLNRELARLSARPDAPGEARDLVRMLEVMYWGLASLMGVVVILLAPVLSRHWFSDSHISTGVVHTTIVLMGLVLVCQWPIALYSGGLLGLQRQVALNASLVVMMTVRNLGAVLALWLVSPTIEAFFVWQLIATAAHAMVVRYLLSRSLPDPGHRARLRPAVLAGVWRFAAGLSATSLLIVVLTQMDKVVLSKLLSLRDFGYYSLATLVASGLVYVFLPIFQAVFPQLSRLVALTDERALSRLYHQACQLVAVIGLPIAAVVACFAPEIMLAWTGDRVIADHTHVVVTLLVAGTALNGLMNIPYALMLANGWTRLPFKLNLIAVIVFLPLLIFSAERYGAQGAAAVWVCVNAGYVLLGITLLHRRLLPGEQARWWSQDVAVPLLAVGAVVVPARLLFPSAAGTPVTVALLTLVLAAALVSSGYATASTRRWLTDGLQLLRRRGFRPRVT
jgi:O-antigen/teichoic acid export membrane protein